MRVALYSVFGVLLFFLTAFVVQSIYDLTLTAEVAQRHQVLTSQLPAYDEIQKSWGNSDVFGKQGTKTNAGLFLNTRLRWVDPKTGEPVYLSSVTAGIVPKRFRHQGEWNWAESTKLKFEGYDFSWLRELGTYDHWSYEDMPPVRAHWAAFRAGLLDTIAFYRNYPAPLFGDLIQFGRMRLSYGITQKKLLTALKEVRNLARLCVSTETRDGFLCGVELVEAENGAFQYGLKNKLISSREWQPLAPPAESLKEGRLNPLLGYFGPDVDDTLIDRTVAAPTNTVGRCMTIADGTLAMARYFGLINRQGTSVPIFPFEKDYAVSLSRLRTIAEKAEGCRYPHVRKFWEDIGEQRGQYQQPWKEQLVMQVPYLRAAFTAARLGATR